MSLLWTIQLQLVFSWTKGSSSTISNARCQPHHPRKSHQPNGLDLTLSLASDRGCLLQSPGRHCRKLAVPEQRNTAYSCSTGMLAELHMVLLFVL